MPLIMVSVLYPNLGTDIEKFLSQLFQDTERLTELIKTWSSFQASSLIADNEKEISGTEPNNTTEEIEAEPSAKKRKLEAEKTFRISCKVTGSYRRKIRGEVLSKKLGTIFRSSLTGWEPSLRNPDLDISVHISDEGVFTGFPITKIPLSKRNYIKHELLRGPVCDLIVAKADIKQGDIVLDPTCGAGTVLIEALHTSLNSPIFCIGVDNSEDVLLKGLQNQVHFNELYPGKSILDFVLADSTRLPFRDGLVDRIVADVPFGKQHSTSNAVPQLYKSLSLSFERICTKDNIWSVLCDPVHSSLFLQENSNAEKTVLKLGETPATLVNIRRKGEEKSDH